MVWFEKCERRINSLVTQSSTGNSARETVRNQGIYLQTDNNHKTENFYTDQKCDRFNNLCYSKEKLGLKYPG